MTENESARSASAIDFLTAFLLSAAALASAFASYQSALWDGEQAAHYSQANGLRTEATRLALSANQSQGLDLVLFNSWAAATAAHEDKLAAYYRQRFRRQFAPAFEAWVALRPLENAAAPASPFEMPQYRVPERTTAEHLERRANQVFSVGQDDNDRGDKFVLATVILANALFFGGISQVIRSRHAQLALLAICALACIVGIGYMFTLPLAP